ncbi:dna-binding protein [Cystoisospora suis]|uniref:Dna-binding protein n=1 Tax=Cystoisospora suis TaxID=483139 RepID=A0A2C6LEP8_9APIC|nr:dna-binding protein [Cystoisospora suis]
MLLGVPRSTVCLLLLFPCETFFLCVTGFKVVTGRTTSPTARSGPEYCSRTSSPRFGQISSTVLSGSVAPSGYFRLSRSLWFAGPARTSCQTDSLETQNVVTSASSLAASNTAQEAAESDADETTEGLVVTRKDLIASVAAELQHPRADVERIFAALLRHISTNLEEGRKISISKFGTFGLRRRGERTARNPRTGEALDVAAATFPTFSFSKVIKERVRDVMPAHDVDVDSGEAVEEKKKSLFSWS